MGRGSLALTCDVTNAASVEAAMQRTAEAFGQVDILVNNAGARGGGDRVAVVDLPDYERDRVMAVNLKGIFVCSRAAAAASSAFLRYWDCAGLPVLPPIAHPSSAS